MNTNLAQILGIELLVASQGVELRAPHKTSQPLQQAIAALRASVPPLGPDRYLANDLAAAAGLVADNHITAAARAALADGLLPPALF
jgi:histidine ammonia-lyase